jgi:beta-glucosidase
MCLLKNENHLLPLKKDLACIAVIGPNANIVRFGDYSEAAGENSAQGMFEQIKKLLSPQTKLLYCSGTNVDDAVATARRAQVVILGLGEWDSISGEGHDRCDLGLPGRQEQLLEAVVATGVPTVLTLQNGRPLVIPWAAAHCPAILEAWYPGESGGQAIAETLFGDNNPAGRLTVSFPRNVGQLPDYYNHFPSRNNGYVEGNDSPQFVFGYGLSYTTFKYRQFTAAAPAREGADDVVFSFNLTNTGESEGDEVAQLYIRKKTASVATPVKALKAFERVRLKPGESKTITLRVKQSDLAIWGADQQWKVETGEYTATIGADSSAELSAKFSLE